MSPLLVPLLVSTALTFAWLWFFVRRDKHPEPPRLLARTFGWGMFAWAVAAAFEGSFEKLPWPLLALLFSAVAEEGSKFLAASTATTEPEFDEPMDGLVYAVTAALGFAFMENLTYTLGFGSGAATWHAVLTTLVHALFSAPQGYGLGNTYFCTGRGCRRRGLALSVAWHAIFNGLLLHLQDNGFLFVALSAVLALMIVVTAQYYLHFERYAREGGYQMRYKDSD